ncbi:MAG TPA: hypothetical protein VHO06_23010 [Polyangia bacterium]|nr:hypothetical protein [Polyangia bacterium]
MESPAASRRITLVKVFTSTTTKGRGVLGDQITGWLAANPAVTVLEAVVTASSDRTFHCLSIVLLCAGEAAGATPPPGRRA